MPKFSTTDPETLPHLKWSSFQQLITEEPCKGFHLMYVKVVGFTPDFYIFHHHMCSVVSRAILKLVYWFGIPNSNLQMLISVDFWCKLLSIFLVAELREWCFELFRMQNSQNFQGFAPGHHWGGLAPHQTPRLHNSYFPAMLVKKLAPPKNCWMRHWSVRNTVPMK